MSRNGGEASSEDTVIAKITLTAKSGIEAKSYPIVFALNEFTTDDYSTITIPDVTKSIEVTANGASQGGSEQGGASQGDEEQCGNLNEKKQIAADSSNSDSDLPYAGDTGRIIKIIAIAVLSVISIFFL